jgi:hypothetical protein
MDALKQSRLRFGLRSLMTVVAACAVAIAVWMGPPSKAFAIRRGMSEREVDAIMGRPIWESQFYESVAGTYEKRDQVERGYPGWVVIFAKGKCVDYLRDEPPPRR